MRPDLTFETTLAASAAALLIAFAALRWLRPASEKLVADPIDRLIHRGEVLTTAVALALVMLVLAASLRALADGAALGRGDRLLSIRYLLVAAIIFVVGVLLEKLAVTLPGDEPGNPIARGRYSQLWAGGAATFALVLTLFQRVVTRDLGGTATAMVLSLAIGLAVWLSVTTLVSRLTRTQRVDVLRFVHARNLQAGYLRARGGDGDGPRVVVLWNPDDAGETVYLTPAAARQLVSFHDHRRFNDASVRDYALSWRPLKSRLRVLNERVGCAVGETDSPDAGLVRLDRWLRLGVLRLDVR